MSQDIIRILGNIYGDNWPLSAKEILAEAVKQWYESGSPYDFITGRSRTDSGDTVFLYSSDGDYKYWICEFVPIYEVEKIIKECERLYDEAAASYKVSKGVALDTKWQEYSRKTGIQTMAVIATRRLLIGIRTKLCEAFEDNLEESMLMATAAFRGRLKMFFEGDFSETREPVDARKDIDEIVDKISKRKREHLIGLLSNVPELRVPKGRGGSEPEVDVSDKQCVLISQDYTILLKHWKNVRRQRNSAPKGNWREHARLDQPDTPDDLLDKLCSLDPYESKPSALAHEHAARRQGIPPNKYSLSTLSRHRRRGDNLRNHSKTRIE